MNLQLNTILAKGYISKAQIARRLTEGWLLENSYCPNCGTLPLKAFQNNQPVADFYCGTCNEEFELKSKSKKLTKIITDGAYHTMIQRIDADNNPNFFFLSYSEEWRVNEFLIVPKHFLTTEIIIKRPPLSSSAVRAGWVGCNIDLSKIPDVGTIFIVKDSKIIDYNDVQVAFKKTLFIRSKNEVSRGWLLDILMCISNIQSNQFTLDDVYKFETFLKHKYPNNHFIKDKIRQQLQILRDKGLIDFCGAGKYKKL